MVMVRLPQLLRVLSSEVLVVVVAVAAAGCLVAIACLGQVLPEALG